MTAAEIRKAIVDALVAVAPETDPELIDPAAPLRDQLDLDSFDFLNVVQALHRTLEVDIPESDYGSLTTLDEAVAYLSRRIATR